MWKNRRFGYFGLTPQVQFRVRDEMLQDFFFFSPRRCLLFRRWGVGFTAGYQIMGQQSFWKIFF